jgi:hypothetical protein
MGGLLDGIAGQGARRLLRRSINIGQIGVAVAAPSGCADGDEEVSAPATAAAGSPVKVRRPAGGDVLLHQLFKARFIDWHTASLRRGQLAGIGLDYCNFGAEISEAGTGNEANIAAADYCYTHVDRTQRP